MESLEVTQLHVESLLCELVREAKAVWWFLGGG